MVMVAAVVAMTITKKHELYSHSPTAAIVHISTTFLSTTQQVFSSTIQLDFWFNKSHRILLLLRKFSKRCGVATTSYQIQISFISVYIVIHTNVCKNVHDVSRSINCLFNFIENLILLFPSAKDSYTGLRYKIRMLYIWTRIYNHTLVKFISWCGEYSSSQKYRCMASCYIV